MIVPLVICATAIQISRVPKLIEEKPWLTVKLQFVVCADDDGKRACDFKKTDCDRLIEIANRVYSVAKIRFEFDLKDGLVTLRDTAVNSIDVVSSPLADQAAVRANQLVAKYRGKLLVLCRWGASSRPTGTGFSGGDSYAVFMPSLRHTNAGPWILAHEMGHYFSLSHTFRSRMRSIAQAEEVLKAHGGDTGVFDGDGFSDTPPDPGISPPKDGPRDSLMLNGVKVPIPYGNIMSYMNWAGHEWLSPQQAERIRQVCEIRQRVGMGWQSNDLGKEIHQAEDLEPTYANGCSGETQNMKRFNQHRWSGGAQLFCHAPVGGSVTLHFRTDHFSLVNLAAYLTLARDYGRIRFFLDGLPVGSVFDGFAFSVVSSGAISLGRQRLSSGEHSLKLEVLGKDKSAQGTNFGIDGIELEQVEERNR